MEGNTTANTGFASGGVTCPDSYRDASIQDRRGK